jgi:hypothetical protein
MFSKYPKLQKEWDWVLSNQAKNPLPDHDDDDDDDDDYVYDDDYDPDYDDMALLLACEDMHNVWQGLEKVEPYFSFPQFLQVIEDAKRWPHYDTDKLTKDRLTKGKLTKGRLTLWNEKVQRLSLELASELKNSRIDEFLGTELFTWLLLPEGSGEDIALDHCRLIATKPYSSASDFLTQLAGQVETDLKHAQHRGTFAYRTPMNAQGQPGQVDAPVRHFAVALSEYFYYLTGQPRRPWVVSLIKALFDGRVVTVQQVTDWAPASGFTVETRASRLDSL